MENHRVLDVLDGFQIFFHAELAHLICFLGEALLAIFLQKNKALLEV